MSDTQYIDVMLVNPKPGQAAALTREIREALGVNLVEGDVRMSDEPRKSSEFPPSSDMVEFFIRGDKIGLHCLVCGEDLPEDVSYLNQAIVEWRKHREAKRQADHYAEQPMNVEYNRVFHLRDTDASICTFCGVLVGDIEQHTKWHRGEN